MNMGQDISFLGVFCVVTLGSLHPESSFTTCRMNLTFSLVYLLTIVYFSPGVTPPKFYAEYGMIMVGWLGMCGLGMARADVPALWTCAWAAMLFYGNQAKNPDLQVDRDRFALDLCLAVLVLVGGFHMYSQTIQSMVEAEVRACASNNEVAACKSLLGSVCDAVVDLTAEIEIKEHSPLLAGILIDPRRDLKGVDFRNLLATEDDRACFDKMMCSPHHVDEPETLARVFPIRMRDASGVSLQMEVFGVRRQDLDSKQSFLIGLREFTDVAPLATDMHRETCKAPAASAISAVDLWSQGEQSLSGSESCPTLLSSSSSCATLLTRCDELWEAESTAISCLDGVNKHTPIVAVDCSTPNLAILRCNFAFAHLRGPSSAGKPLSAWLSKSGFDEVFRLSQLMFNDAMYSESEGCEHESVEEAVVLTPPGMGKALTFKAKCIVACLPPRRCAGAIKKKQEGHCAVGESVTTCAGDDQGPNGSSDSEEESLESSALPAAIIAFTTMRRRCHRTEKSRGCTKTLADKQPVTPSISSSHTVGL